MPASAGPTQTGKTVRDGQTLNFVANIAAATPKCCLPVVECECRLRKERSGDPEYRGGLDRSGTSRIVELVVEVWVAGTRAECVIQESTKVRIIAPATKFGEFGELEWKATTENLKVLADFLAQSPDNL
jgi:hypothetical protein